MNVMRPTELEESIARFCAERAKDPRGTALWILAEIATAIALGWGIVALFSLLR